MKIPRLFHNPVSYVGALIFALALLVFFFLIILDAVTPHAQAPYASLILFIVVPAFMMSGLALIPIGWLAARRRLRRTGHYWIEQYPVIDLNDRHQRTLLAAVVVGGIFLLFLSAFGSYHAYEATESVAFCGTLCHNVMEPEHTAYLNSPHARVRCVDCHVGPGAEWYVKSKMSGLYQVYAVLLDKYPRPIPVPIHNLRPAQETCEQCHWPEKFFEGQLRRQMHFLSDDENTPWEINLLIKTGGGSPRGGQQGGIHWHMNVENEVTYIATDEQRQQIPWVKLTNRRTGQVTEFMSTESPLTDEQRASGRANTMDCMDCHNRPTHIYRAPANSINVALAAGRIDRTLPAVRRTGMELLTGEYETAEQAAQAIETGLLQFYRDNHPELLESKRESIAAAVAALQNIYRVNFFPRMKVRWDVYPDNIGHMMFPGCFRCHDGLHQSKDGKVISKECSLCHTIEAQGPPDGLKFTNSRNGLEFEHPVDIGTDWLDSPCNDCHTGGPV